LDRRGCRGSAVCVLRVAGNFWPVIRTTGPEGRPGQGDHWSPRHRRAATV